MKKYLFLILFSLGLTNVALSQPHSTSEVASHEWSQHSKKQLDMRTMKRTPGAEKFDIVYQRCEWNVDPSNPELRGKITYHFTTTENNVDKLVFNFSDSMTVDVVEQRSSRISFTHSENLVRVSLSKVLSQNELDSISITYHGIPDASDNRTYRYESGYNPPLVWTHSEPYGSEIWFPCKNDLQDKADSMDIFIAVPEGNAAASNGKLMSITPTENGKNVYYWKSKSPIASYLISFAVSAYVSYSDWYVRNETDSLEVLNYVFPQSLLAAQQKTPATVDILRTFENLFGRYPFSEEKYGHVETTLGGGMEHQTMTTMGNFGESLIAHELAHQWFVDMVTCGSWSEIWLNEGFATYAEGLYWEENDPDTEWIKWKKNNLSGAQSPSGAVYCYDTTMNFFTSLVYSKGALVLHTLRWVLGDEDFFQAIWNYVHDPQLKYGFAKTPDLQRHFEAASGKDLSEFFDSWIYKEGYPNYIAKVTQQNEEHATLALVQQPTHSSVAYFKLPVPIQFIGNEKDTIIVFDNGALEQTFEFNPGFFIKNVVIDPEIRILCKGFASVTGIDEVDQRYFVNIFPNPAKDELSIRFCLPEKAAWSIIDMSGKIQKTGKLTQLEGIEQILLSDFSSGSYFLRFQCENKIITEKIVIAK